MNTARILTIIALTLMMNGTASAQAASEPRSDVQEMCGHLSQLSAIMARHAVGGHIGKNEVLSVVKNFHPKDAYWEQEFSENALSIRIGKIYDGARYATTLSKEVALITRWKEDTKRGCLQRHGVEVAD